MCFHVGTEISRSWAKMPPDLEGKVFIFWYDVEGIGLLSSMVKKKYSFCFDKAVWQKNIEKIKSSLTGKSAFKFPFLISVQGSLFPYMYNCKEPTFGRPQI